MIKSEDFKTKAIDPLSQASLCGRGWGEGRDRRRGVERRKPQYLPREAFRNFTAFRWFFWASSTSFWCLSPCSFCRYADLLQGHGAAGTGTRPVQAWPQRARDQGQVHEAGGPCAVPGRGRGRGDPVGVHRLGSHGSSRKIWKRAGQGGGWESRRTCEDPVPGRGRGAPGGGCVPRPAAHNESWHKKSSVIALTEDFL